MTTRRSAQVFVLLVESVNFYFNRTCTGWPEVYLIGTARTYVRVNKQTRRDLFSKRLRALLHVLVVENDAHDSGDTVVVVVVVIFGSRCA